MELTKAQKEYIIFRLYDYDEDDEWNMDVSWKIEKYVGDWDDYFPYALIIDNCVYDYLTETVLEDMKNEN